MSKFAIKLKTLKKITPVFILFLIVSIILTVYLFNQSNQSDIAITNTIPADQTPNTLLTTKIIINFSQPISNPDQLVIQLIPPTPGTLTFNQPSQAEFSPNELLQANTLYQIKLFYDRHPLHSFSFTTQNLDANSGFQIPQFLNPDAPQTDIYQNMQNFVSSLPHNTENYSIEYLATSNLVIINIFEEPADQYEQQAIEYIQSFGIPNPELQFNITIENHASIIPPVVEN